MDLQSDNVRALVKALSGDAAALADVDPDRIESDYWAGVARMMHKGFSPEAIREIYPDLPVRMAQIRPDGEADLATAALAERWTLYGPEYLLQPPEPPKYLVHGMIRQGALVCVYGAPGGLKSLFMQDLAVCVAAGIPWLEPLPGGRGEGGAYPVKQAPVLWMDQDNGRNRLRERFGALLRARNLSDVPLQAVSLPVPPFDASKQEDAELLTAQIGALEAGLCVIDNLGTVSGGRDENSSDMVGVMANLRWAAEETGAAIIVIHHPRKGGAGNGGGREGDRLRGHSSIEASLDLALSTERDGDDLTAQSTKTRDDPVKPFTVRWTFERTPHGALDRARFWHVRTEKPRVPEYVQIGTVLPDMINGQGFDSENALRKAIMAEFDVTKVTADRAIKHAVSEGTIKAEPTGDYPTAPKRYTRVDLAKESAKAMAEANATAKAQQRALPDGPCAQCGEPATIRNGSEQWCAKCNEMLST